MGARKSDLKIDVARVVEIVLDSSTGETVIRFRDKRGRIVTTHLEKRQFNTLLKGVLSANRHREVSPRSSRGRSERAILKAELTAAGGNVSRAARQLGMARSTLRYRLKIHGLEGMI
jgi:transcriptional regulator of acetoin/glycerol metabolism